MDVPPSRDASLRVGPLALAVILACTFSSALGINPYYYGAGDNRITIPFLKAFVNPSLYPADPMLAERPFYYTYLWNVLGVLHARLGWNLPLLFLGTYLAALYLTFLSVYLLSLELFRNRASAVLALVFLVFSHMTLGGIPTVDPMLTTRAVATPIALFAIRAFLQRKTMRAFSLLGLAYLVHPLTTHYALAMLVVAAVLVRRPHGLRQLATGLLAFLAVASPLLFWRLQHSPGSLHLFTVDPGWLEALRLRSPHHMFPFTWGLSSLLHGLVAVALFFLAAHHGESESAERRAVVEWAAWTILVMCAVGIIFSELLPAAFVFLFQPMRSFAFMELFVMLYLAHYLAGPTETSRPLMDGVVALLTGFWISFEADTPVQPVVEFAVVAAVVAIRRFGWREGPLARNYVAATACMVCLGGWACYLDDRFHEGGSMFSIDVAVRSEWRDVQHWAMRNTDVRDAFIVPPGEEGEFRVEGERTVYGDWEEGGLMNGDPAFGRAWLKRMRALGYKETSGAFRYSALGVPDLVRIAAEMAMPGRRIFVVRSSADRPLDLAVRYRNSDFTVYELPQHRPSSG